MTTETTPLSALDQTDAARAPLAITEAPPIAQSVENRSSSPAPVQVGAEPSSKLMADRSSTQGAGGDVTQDIQSAMFDSAELATRSASLAVKVGLEMHQAAQELIKTSVAQQKMNKILLGAFGGMLLLALTLFTIISYRLQDRVRQLDAMVLAVGKRVISMDAAVELFDSVSDVIKDVSQKQDVISSGQGKLEQRIDEAIKSAPAVPDLKAKPVDDKTKELLKLIQEVNAKLQLQSNSVKSVSAQIQKMQSSLPNSSNFRRDMEAMVQQIQERSVPEATPGVATPTIVKQRERLVQFPRTSGAGATTEKP